MKPEIKKLWVEALRSGEYKQGRGALRNYKNEFCCLGVLCNLHAQAHPEIAAKQLSQEKYLGSRALVPEPVAEWAGFPDPVRDGLGPRVRPTGYSLGELNDAGWSFQSLAKLIEEQL